MFLVRTCCRCRWPWCRRHERGCQRRKQTHRHKQRSTWHDLSHLKFISSAAEKVHCIILRHRSADIFEVVHSSGWNFLRAKNRFHPYKKMCGKYTKNVTNKSHALWGQNASERSDEKIISYDLGLKMKIPTKKKRQEEDIKIKMFNWEQTILGAR